MRVSLRQATKPNMKERQMFSCVAVFQYYVQGKETLGTLDINKKITSKKI